VILNNKSIGMVGSRDATDYGKNVARDISKKMADEGYNVISGLARGIDKYSHLGALDSKVGKTIAVLGTGIDDKSVYPLENKRIYERILEEGGTIISEYPIGTKPNSYNFPARNRIISGLSDKILIVEAGIKSGSLITADFALEQGKDIWAVPGNIYSKNSEGTNRLISEGANIFIDVEELL
jgi:DNA processing protein